MLLFFTFLARRNLATTNGNDGHSIVSLASSDGFSGLDSRSHNLAHFTSPHVRFFLHIRQYFSSNTANTKTSLYQNLVILNCQHLNFGLSWPGQGQRVKAKHCYSLKFSLLCTDTALSQSSIGAQYSKQNMIKFSQCLAELAQKFKFL